MNEFPILLYTTPEGGVKVNAVLKDETLWLTQTAMAGLFGVQKAAISKHLKNIFESGELVEAVVVSKMETTTPHGAIAGKTQEHAVNFYNLDAKNYLTEKQIRQLELAVSGFFDHIESLILREQTFTMKEFAESVDAFLSFGRYQILKGRGLITREAADAKAIEEYDAYNRQLKFESDFDKQIRKFLDGSGPRARQA